MVTDIAEEISKISRTEFKLRYNELEYNSMNIHPDSRCDNFGVYYFKKDQRHPSNSKGLLFELIKGRLIVSVFYTNVYQEEIMLDEIMEDMPIRFKEAVARIKKLNASKDKVELKEDYLKDFMELLTSGVKSNRIQFIGNHDSLNSTMIYTIRDLINNKDNIHTYIYQNKPFFGKNNALFKVSRNRHIPLPDVCR